MIVGGESGPGARPCDVEWIDSIRDQCKAAGVACFIKQLGSRVMRCDPSLGVVPIDLRHSKGGDMSEWPKNLRVRQWPERQG